MEDSMYDFNLLVSTIINNLKENCDFSNSSIYRFEYAYRRIGLFLESRNYNSYKSDFDDEIRHFFFNGKSRRSLNDQEHYIDKALCFLFEFVKTKNISSNRKKKKPEFEGELGEIIIFFLAAKKISFNPTSKRYRHYLLKMYEFYEYCFVNNIKFIRELNLKVIIAFISQLHNDNITNVDAHITVLKNFFQYTFEKGHININLSVLMPKYNTIKLTKLPSVYSGNEIQVLLNSINRTTNIGKRNYAIILLASKLGLRASDIGLLKFNNLNWERSTLSIIQYKTQREITLPLTAEIGNAIIDYMICGRPPSCESFVFLTCKKPFVPFYNSNIITHIVQRSYKKAGINIDGRRFGSHSLRHSLANNMINNSVALPIVSTVLGHKSSVTTSNSYLRIDFETLKSCRLEVLHVPKNFYVQKAAIFYE